MRLTVCAVVLILGTAGAGTAVAAPGGNDRPRPTQPVVPPGPERTAEVNERPADAPIPQTGRGNSLCLGPEC